jgi:hypothetical protein
MARMSAAQGSGHPTAGFVVKVTTDTPDYYRWIAEPGPSRVRWLGARSDARVFATRAAAEQEIQVFYKLLTGTFHFDIEPA